MLVYPPIVSLTSEFDVNKSISMIIRRTPYKWPNCFSQPKYGTHHQCPPVDWIMSIESDVSISIELKQWNLPQPWTLFSLIGSETDKAFSHVGRIWVWPHYEETVYCLFQGKMMFIIMQRSVMRTICSWVNYLVNPVCKFRFQLHYSMLNRLPQFYFWNNSELLLKYYYNY